MLRNAITRYIMLWALENNCKEEGLMNGTSSLWLACPRLYYVPLRYFTYLAMANIRNSHNLVVYSVLRLGVKSFVALTHARTHSSVFYHHPSQSPHMQPLCSPPWWWRTHTSITAYIVKPLVNASQGLCSLGPKYAFRRSHFSLL
jgi:hypothetical protein